jgi:hypothetical protein
MKYVVVLICLISISTNTSAQIEKKAVMLGGNASIMASTGGSSLFNFNPSAAVFVNNKMAVGVSGFLMLLDGDFYWGAAPFSRYYFSPQKSQSFFVSGSANFSNLNYNIVGLTAGVGNVWFINRNVGFETELRGLSDFDELSFGMFLGLQVYLSKSK